MSRKVKYGSAHYCQHSVRNNDAMTHVIYMPGTSRLVTHQLMERYAYLAVLYAYWATIHGAGGMQNRYSPAPGQRPRHHGAFQRERTIDYYLFPFVTNTRAGAATLPMAGAVRKIMDPTIFATPCLLVVHA